MPRECVLCTDFSLHTNFLYMKEKKKCKLFCLVVVVSRSKLLSHTSQFHLITDCTFLCRVSTMFRHSTESLQMLPYDKIVCSSMCVHCDFLLLLCPISSSAIRTINVSTANDHSMVWETTIK